MRRLPGPSSAALATFPAGSPEKIPGEMRPAGDSLEVGGADPGLRNMALRRGIRSDGGRTGACPSASGHSGSSSISSDAFGQPVVAEAMTSIASRQASGASSRSSAALRWRHVRPGLPWANPRRARMHRTASGCWSSRAARAPGCARRRRPCGACFKPLLEGRDRRMRLRPRRARRSRACGDSAVRSARAGPAARSCSNSDDIGQRPAARAAGRAARALPGVVSLRR